VAGGGLSVAFDFRGAPYAGVACGDFLTSRHSTLATRLFPFRTAFAAPSFQGGSRTRGQTTSTIASGAVQFVNRQRSMAEMYLVSALFPRYI
jgi:hypothetical protein